MTIFDGIPIVAALISVLGAGIVAYYRWSYYDLLSRENILKGFKYEIEILHTRINSLRNEGDSYFDKPLYNKGGLFYVYNGSVSRFNEAIAKDLINYYSNIDLSERILRNKPIDNTNKDLIISLLEESQIIESTLLSNIDSELVLFNNIKREKYCILILGIALIVSGIFLFFMTPKLFFSNWLNISL